MNVTGQKIQRLSFDELGIICGFLKVPEINTLSSTCKEFYDAFYVHSYC